MAVAPGGTGRCLVNPRRSHDPVQRRPALRFAKPVDEVAADAGEAVAAPQIQGLARWSSWAAAVRVA
jgi:hypothetical protein